MLFQDLSGRTFGRLTVIKPAKRDKNKKILFLCLCSCGNYVEVVNQRLKDGRTKSCGCLRVDTQRLSYKNESLHNKLYNLYSLSAKRRGREFSLSKEYFISLISKPCYYCGHLPSNVLIMKDSWGKSLLYNGIDRVDNSLGYTETNCVTCCETCNRAKLKMTQEEFLAWIIKVFNNLASNRIKN